MKVKQKKLDDGRVRLSVTATAEDVNKAFDIAERSFASSLGLQPNPDTTARQAIADKLKIHDVDSILLSQAADALTPFAIEKSGLTPQFMPEKESNEKFQRNRPFSFHVLITPKPLYKLRSYDPVSVTVPKFTFDDTGIEEQMLAYVRQFPVYEAAAPHPLQKDDNCLISLHVTHDGEPVKNLCTESRTYTLGQGFMPDSFEEQIYGMQPGETKSFDFEAPDFDEDGNETTSTFSATITIQELQEQAEPQLTDEWIKQAMPMFGSVDDFRTMFSRSAEQQQRKAYNDQLSYSVQMKWAERFEGKIPDEAYEATSKSLDQAMRAQAASQNMKFDDFVEQQGGKQSYQMSIMVQTREMLQRDYALDAVFDHEHLSITDEDIRDACREINPQNPASVQKTLEDEGKGFALREMASRIAASKWCVEHADITVRD